MKRTVVILILAGILQASSALALSLSERQAAVLAPSLVAVLSAAPADTVYDLLIVPTAAAQTQRVLPQVAAATTGRVERYHAVYAKMVADATHHQDELAAAITRLGGGAHAEVVRRFWVADVLQVRLDRAAMLELASSGNVGLIAPNPQIELLQPVAVGDAVLAAAGAQENLAAIGARALWARGLTGAGRLIASIDTGVEGIHPALRDRWRGRLGDTASAWYDPLGATSPADSNGHGTHVMGVMVGRDGADTIGVAPDAEWMTAAVIDRGRSLTATFADILAAFEWIADPDGDPSTTEDVPDVVCNSWGVSQTVIKPCDSLFFAAIDNVEALGIVCVFAAGNEGPYSMTMRNPADHASSPTTCFAVGAADATGTDLSVPSFSSRGPSACNGPSVKPDLAAPGVSIRSAYKGQSYKIISGTSMAAPHVAGAVALLRQYNPDLTPEQIKTALMAGARDIDATGEDNNSGHGLLDLEAALAHLPAPVTPRVALAGVASDPAGDGILAAGETVPVVTSLRVDDQTASGLVAHLVPLTAGAVSTVDRVAFGTVAAGETVTNSDSPFLVTLPATIRAGDSLRLELNVSGDPPMQAWTDTISLLVGLPAGALVTTVGEEPAALSVSNFGQIGVATGSALDAGGAGWVTSLTPANTLYEGALIIMAADGAVADASRRTGGELPFDFAPLGVAEFDDSRAAQPVGVQIVQNTYYANDVQGYEYTTVSWTVHNRTAAAISDLQLGLLLDIDRTAQGEVAERAYYDAISGGVYHVADGEEVAVGVALLTGTFAARRFIANSGGEKTVLDAAAKRAAFTSGTSVPSSQAQDYLEILATNPIDLAVGDSVTVAVAFIVAPTASEFPAAAADARDRWLRLSGITEDGGTVGPPSKYRLSQNYPNPFNASTIIPVEIDEYGTTVRLEVLDLLGRTVRTLVSEEMAVGRHLVAWDGTDAHGARCASGVYFVRLTVGGSSGSVRRVVLLK